MNFLLIVHAVATCFMAGLIWFVQIVHYPLFARVGKPEFAEYEVAHQRLTTWVVAPAMLLELVTAVLIAFSGSAVAGRTVTVASLIALVLIWGITAAVQVPQHRALADGFDNDVWVNLVRGNWWRTALWTARVGIVAWIVWYQMQPVAAPGS